MSARPGSIILSPRSASEIFLLQRFYKLTQGFVLILCLRFWRHRNGKVNNNVARSDQSPHQTSRERKEKEEQRRHGASLLFLGIWASVCRILSFSFFVNELGFIFCATCQVFDACIPLSAGLWSSGFSLSMYRVYSFALSIHGVGRWRMCVGQGQGQEDVCLSSLPVDQGFYGSNLNWVPWKRRKISCGLSSLSPSLSPLLSSNTHNTHL